MKAISGQHLRVTWTSILVHHRNLILYLVGLFGWVVAVPLYGDTMALWATEHGASIVNLSNCFLIAHALSLIVTGINLDRRPSHTLTIVRLVPFGNGMLLVLVLLLPPCTWAYLFVCMGIATAFGMTAWGRWYATSVKIGWLGQTFALSAAGVAAFHFTFGVLAKYVPTAWVLLSSFLPLTLAWIAIRKQNQLTFSAVQSLPNQASPLSERLRTGFRCGLFICFFSVVAGLSDRFFVAVPISPFAQDFLRMVPYMIGVLVSGVVADLSGLLWVMVGGAGVLAASFLIGAWSNHPELAILGLFCNGLAFGLLEPAPWLLLASTCTPETAGRWFGWGLNLNVIPLFVGTVITVPLGHITANRLGLLATFFILLAILFLHGIRDPLAAIHKLAVPTQLPQPHRSDDLMMEQFELSFGDVLSEREKEIGKLAIKGKSNHEIAELLFISENTVKSHLKNVFRKTQCANRNDLYRTIVQRPHQ